MINVVCPSCGSTLNVNESKLGQIIKCPLCGNSFTAEASVGKSISSPNTVPMAPSPLPPPTLPVGGSTINHDLGIGIKTLLYLIMLLPGINLLVLIISHLLFVSILKNSKAKAMQLLIHSWIGFAIGTFIALILFFGFRAFNMYHPEVFFELTSKQVEMECVHQLQELFDLPQDYKQDNTMYIYAGATVKSLQLEHIGKCQYQGRVIFELADKEYSRPVSVQYKRDTLSDEPDFIFDLTHGSYADTPDELREDMSIAYKKWQQRHNKGVEGWQIVDMTILANRHPIYTIRLSCERIGNTGKRYPAEMSAELTFANLTMGRYYPHLKFFNIGHEILHSYFIYSSLGKKFKDGVFIKECRLKQCTGNVDLFSVKFSDNTPYVAYVTLGDDFSFNIQKLEKNR